MVRGRANSYAKAAKVVASELYREDNLFDRFSAVETLEFCYEHMLWRERSILDRYLGFGSGSVLSIGCGWHPGRHLFPSPGFRLVAVDASPGVIAGVVEGGAADVCLVGRAGELDFPADSFDVVLYRLVLHHIAFQEPLHPCFVEASRLLKPGGAMIAIEPGLWHPVGLGLAVANRLGLGTAIHGTPDDVPLSPLQLAREARGVGLVPEVHAVTYGWRRLPRVFQKAMRPLDRFGSRERAALFGHTLLLIARKPHGPAPQK
jgi:SAM-dependent methyltransferase